MKGTEKQVQWATDILSKFSGTTQNDLMGAFRKAGQGKVAAAGITGPQSMPEFVAKCDLYVKSNADAKWLIDNKNFLGLAAAEELLK